MLYRNSIQSKTVLIVRHLPSIANQETGIKAFMRPQDSDLYAKICTDDQTAEKINSNFNSVRDVFLNKSTAFYVSPLVRTWETLSIILGSLSNSQNVEVSATILNELQEKSSSKLLNWDPDKSNSCSNSFEDALNKFTTWRRNCQKPSAGLNIELEEGETWCQGRGETDVILAKLNRLINHATGDVVIVAHNNVCKQIFKTKVLNGGFLQFTWSKTNQLTKELALVSKEGFDKQFEKVSDYTPLLDPPPLDSRRRQSSYHERFSETRKSISTPYFDAT